MCNGFAHQTVLFQEEDFSIVQTEYDEQAKLVFVSEVPNVPRYKLTVTIDRIDLGDVQDLEVWQV